MTFPSFPGLLPSVFPSALGVGRVCLLRNTVWMCYSNSLQVFFPPILQSQLYYSLLIMLWFIKKQRNNGSRSFFYTTILNFPGVVREPNLWTFEPNIWWISDTQSAVSELTKSTCLFTLTTSPEIIITTINYWFSALVNLWLVLSSCLFTLFNLSGTELIINTTVKRWQWDETSTFDIVVNKRKWLSNELSTSWLIMEKL